MPTSQAARPSSPRARCLRASPSDGVEFTELKHVELAAAHPPAVENRGCSSGCEPGALYLRRHCLPSRTAFFSKVKCKGTGLHHLRVSHLDYYCLDRLKMRSCSKCTKQGSLAPQSCAIRQAACQGLAAKRNPTCVRKPLIGLANNNFSLGVSPPAIAPRWSSNSPMRPASQHLVPCCAMSFRGCLLSVSNQQSILGILHMEPCGKPIYCLGSSEECVPISCLLLLLLLGLT